SIPERANRRGEGGIGMLGREKVLEILNGAVAYSDAEMTQAAIGIGQSSLTRFANSTIHQNVSERNAQLAVKAVIGKRIGYALTNRLDDDSIRAAVAQAVQFARNTQENSDFVTLPEPKPIPHVEAYDERTAAYSPEDRAGDVASIISEARKFDASAAGQLSTGYEEYAVVNSLGVSAYYPSTMASLTAVMTADTGFGYADRFSARIADIGPIEAAVEAATRSIQSRNPEGIDPGEYDVVLLPYAVSEFVEFLSWLGFSALAVQESRSFMTGKFGEKITGENITIWDDALDPAGIPRPFDCRGDDREHEEGHPRHEVPLH
ncbi:MAG: metallopeptidase TldD-related protein, partial [Armatimonadetes bacterium]|nr:metallopeptidase TldD-related protein [Armatimonadota bacterium]